MQDLGAVVANVLEVVSGGARKPAAMREQVTDGELAGRIGIGEPEGRIEVGDLRIPGPIPSLTSAATTVAETGLESEAIWNTVSASTASGLPASRCPKPLRKITSSSCTTPMARPGTAPSATAASASASSFDRAAAMRSGVMSSADAARGQNAMKAMKAQMRQWQRFRSSRTIEPPPLQSPGHSTGRCRRGQLSHRL
ncbi:hypothetical protein AJ88_20270 [Mesorhizobium amorphae CCBAU 01583]|nr:hypothetical protein AJ88_20270 [Mesorhizobium amorphae CCBAU 01583]